MRLNKSVFGCMYRCACVLNCQVEEECVWVYVPVCLCFKLSGSECVLVYVQVRLCLKL